MKEYIISNMKCQGCVTGIEKMLKNSGFVKSVDINLLTSIMKIELEKDEDEEKVLEIVRKLGYGIEEKNRKYNRCLLYFPDIKCQGCVTGIEKILSGIEGIIDARVNLITKLGEIEYHKDLIKIEEIIDKLKIYGYNSEEYKEKTDIENKKGSGIIIEIILGIVILYLSMGKMIGIPIIFGIDKFPKVDVLIQFLISLLAIYFGKNYYLNGFRALKNKIPNMDSLVFLGTGASFLYSCYMMLLILSGYENNIHNLYFESTVVVLSLISLGKYLEEKSKKKTGDSLRKLLSLKQNIIHVIKDNIIIDIDISKLKFDDIVLVKDGEIISVDGEIISGECEVDESFLTGESIPKVKKEKDKVYAGTLNIQGIIKIKIQKMGDETILSKVIKLVEDAQTKKAPIAKLADEVSKYFVPVVILIAVITGIVWFLLIKLNPNITEDKFLFLKMMVSVLVIACPCSLGLATPTAMMVSIGRGAELGILIKTGEALQKLSEIDTIILDKTGTITEGQPKVIEIVTDKIEEKELLKIVASLESYSEHILAKAIKERYNSSDYYMVENFKTTIGKGVSGNLLLENKKIEVLMGKKEWLLEKGIEVEENEKLMREETIIYIAIDNNYMGALVVSDEIKKDSKKAIDNLKEIGIDIYMITGDGESVAKKVSKQVGIDNYEYSVSPKDKYDKVVELKNKSKKVLMVGDGINDAPALAIADIGMAMGSGSDIALESSDLVLLNNNLEGILNGILLSKKTIKNIKENLFWAFIYNTIGIPLAAGVLYRYGIILNPMIAGGCMALSSICVVLNALRLRKFTDLSKR